MKISKRLQVHFRRATSALSNRNFRFFLTGQLISYTGFWINNIAMSWLVYRLTGSAALLGLVTFTSQFPTFLLAPFAGVHVDRLNRKRVLQITIGLSAIQSLLLGVLALTNVITVTQLIILGIAQAIIDAFYLPARQAFLSEIISDKQTLSNAIALNAASFHFARLVGPAIGGILIYFIGEGGCFVIDAISYIAVLISLFFINPDIINTSKRVGSVLQDLGDGINYILTNTRVRLLISFVSFFCLIGISHTMLLPVLVRQHYEGSSNLLGILVGSSGFGSLVGAIVLAVKSNEASLIQRMRLCGILFAISLTMISLLVPLPITILCLFICGFCFITIAAGANTLIQTAVPDHYRGRVMSFFAMSFTGMMPLGAIGSGWVADVLGLSGALLIAGVFAAIGGIWFWFQDKQALSIQT